MALVGEQLEYPNLISGAGELCNIAHHTHIHVHVAQRRCIFVQYSDGIIELVLLSIVNGMFFAYLKFADTLVCITIMKALVCYSGLKRPCNAATVKAE